MTSTDVIKDRITEASDGAYYCELYAAACKFSGVRPTVTSADEGRIPVWNTIRQSQDTIADTHYARDELSVLLGSITGRPVVPQFPDINSPTEKQIRAEYFTAGVRGHGQREAWYPAHQRFAMWGLGFALGGCVVTVQQDTQGRGYLHHESVAGVNLLFDRHAESAHDAKWVAYFQYLSKEEAIESYGDRVAERSYKITTERAGSSVASSDFESVRLLHYYDESTYVCFLDDQTGDVLVSMDNPYGIIPIALMTGEATPMSRDTVGVVQKILPIQDAMNRIDRMSYKIAETPSIDIISSMGLSEDQLTEAVEEEGEDGLPVQRLMVETLMDKQDQVSVRIPAPELTAESQMIYERLRREKLPQASGVNDLMRGQLADTSRTAREVQEVADQSSGRLSALKNTYALAMAKLYSITAVIAGLGYDVAPIPVKLKGATLILNGDNPDFTCETVFSEESRVVINPDDLFGSEAKKTKEANAEQYQGLLQLAMTLPGILDPAKIVDLLLDTYGVDGSLIKMDAGAMMPMAGTGGPLPAPAAPGPAPA